MNWPGFIARRHFLSGVTATAVGLVARGISRTQADAGARLTIAYADAGRPIASDFVGLSYESAILAAGDYFAPENGSVLGLIRSLRYRTGEYRPARRSDPHPRMETHLWAQPRARHAPHPTA
jgi:hypothetical protein